MGLSSRAHLLAQVLALIALSLSPCAWGGTKFKVLHNFGAGKDGSGPFGSLILDGRGNLYGVTGSGGTGQCSDYGCGTVFELGPKPKGIWSEKVLHNFTAGGDGSAPWGSLLTDRAGNLYGTLHGDLSFAVDGAFKLGRASGQWVNVVIYNGYAGPGLLFDHLGNLYGDIGSGQYKEGAIGELTAGSGGWAYSPLYSYCARYNCPGGTDQPAPPVWDGKGNLFGTTYEGGIDRPACWTNAGCGVIFEMTPNGDGSWAYHVLHRFASYFGDGQTPAAGLVIDAAGNFYGNTSLGGANNNGTVFKFSFVDGNWKKTVLYDFPNYANGVNPGNTMVFDKLGNLYGVATSGGIVGCGGYTCGVVFKLTPQKSGKWKYTVLHKLTGADGGFPWGVIVDGKGNIFGTTPQFGKYDAGTAFEITP
jgi:uncharacterized repeat protein (TIGR03803 family)